MLDKITELLDKLGPFLYIVIPTIFGIYYNVQSKLKDKKKEIDDQNKAKAKKEYKIWEHEESQRVIRKIKEQCNLHKDRSSAGLAQYLQLENGTVAKSKICNMFISCLAEDDRYGKVQKLSSKIQRVPYSKVTGWIDKIMELKSSDLNYILTEDVHEADYSLSEIVDAPDVESCIVAPVYEPTGTLLGMCVFYYAEHDFCSHRDSEIQLINRFRISIEEILLEYHLDREAKKKEYGLTDGDLNE